MEMEIRVSDRRKTRTYYSTQPVENTYLQFPEESREEYIEALASNGDKFQITNLGDYERYMVIEF